MVNLAAWNGYETFKRESEKEIHINRKIEK